MDSLLRTELLLFFLWFDPIGVGCIALIAGDLIRRYPISMCSSCWHALCYEHHHEPGALAFWNHGIRYWWFRGAYSSSNLQTVQVQIWAWCWSRAGCDYQVLNSFISPKFESPSILHSIDFQYHCCSCYIWYFLDMPCRFSLFSMTPHLPNSILLYSIFHHSGSE